MSGTRLASGMGTALLALIALCPMSHSSEAEVTGQRTTLGLTVENLDGDLLDRLAYRSGVLVTAVGPGSLAEQAGIEKGDVLVVVGSVTLRAVDDLARAESAIVPGEPVSVVFSRNGGRLVKMIKLEPPAPAATADATEPQTLEHESGTPLEKAAPELADRTSEAAEDPAETQSGDEPAEDDVEESATPQIAPAPQPAPAPSTLSAAPEPPGGELVALGLRCEDLNPDFAAALGMPRGRGALVLHVADRSPAALAGIKAGDVITRAGEQRIWGVEHLSNALRAGAGNVSLGLRRRGAERFVEVAVAQPASEPAEVAEAPRVAPADEGIDGLREEMRSLRREVRRLRQEIDEMRNREPL